MSLLKNYVMALLAENEEEASEIYAVLSEREDAELIKLLDFAQEVITEDKEIEELLRRIDNYEEA